MNNSDGFLQKYVKDYKFIETLEPPEKSKHRRVYRKFMNKNAGSTSLIESYDDFIDNQFASQIEDQSFTAEDGTRIDMVNPKIYKPVHIIDGEEKPVYPQYCRDHSIPYRGRISAECHVTKTNGEKIVTKMDLGHLPVMLGSKLCNLRGKTQEELVELGECITDPFGYFVIKSERSLIIQDKKRMIFPVVYYDPKIGKIICEYTSQKGTLGYSNLRLTIGKKWGVLKVKDNYDDKKTNVNTDKNIPVFIMFKILDDTDPEEAYTKYIEKFIPTKHRRKIRNFLDSSIIKVKNMRDAVEYLCVKRNKKFSISKRSEILQGFKDSMLKCLFKNLTETEKDSETFLKLNLLAYIVVRYSLISVGLMRMDSRDSWANKRFDCAGTSVNILLNGCLHSLFSNCRRDITRYSTNPDFSVFGNTLRSKAQNQLNREFTRFFNIGTTTTNSVPTSKNVSEQTKRDTPLSLWSISAKNTSNVSTKDKKMSVREVHESQMHCHCVAETPESEQVSLVKFLATTCRISLATDENIVINYAEGYFGKENEIIDGEPCDYIFNLNGRFIRHRDIPLVYCNEKTKKHILNGKMMGDISMDIEIYIDRDLKTLFVYTDASRPTVPYLVVNQETNNLVIDEIDGWDLSYEELITSGSIEYMSAFEKENPETLISRSVDHFYEMKEKVKTMTKNQHWYRYSHCTIDPNQLLGLPASVCPMTNHQNVTRTTFNCAMAKQALGYFHINYDKRFYGSKEGFKRLYRATRPICETEASFLPKLDVLPAGQTAMVGFLTEPDNQEDAVVVSEDFINSGNINYFKYIMVKHTQPGLGVGIKETLERPPLSTNESPDKYLKINEDGLPKLDAYMKEGDCVIGKVRRHKNGKIENSSIYCGVGEEGYVERIVKSREGEQGNLQIAIKLRLKRKYIAGDKLAIRYAQKGTVGRVEKNENLPIVMSGPNKGMTTDIIFNPLGYPSRQTVGLLLEGLLSKAALYDGKRVDASSFAKLDIDGARETLSSNGLDDFGYEEVNFKNGRTIENKITIVPLYEQVLKHHVKDKIQMRSSGNKSLYTHQPKGGRAIRGGQKIGEMEKDAFVAHGATNVILERMMKSSDEFKITVCQNCGIVIGNKNCTLCGNSQPGILVIPYVFKLLINLLNGACIDVRINTKKKDLGM